jgi:TPR repeat protein
MKDHYQTLGLERSASEKQIKQAYRGLCKQYHPDHNKSSDAHARMQEINEACRILSSPVRRAEYDQLLRLQEQQGQPTTDGASGHGTTEQCRCEKCGRVDPTLRVAVFTWVVSLLVVTYRRGWAKILCARCRTKYALLFDLQNFFMGWWGIPFGLLWTLQALWHNSLGGQQPEENNALFLSGLGYEFHRKGDLKAAASALKASLHFKKDPRVEAFYRQTQARFHETPAAYTREPRLSVWGRFATGALHPALYCAPLLALLFGVGYLWIESDKKPAVRARSGGGLRQDSSRQDLTHSGFDENMNPGFVRAAPSTHPNAAEQGDAEAQFNLAYCLATGNGRAKDTVEGVKWYRKAAEQGHAVAQFNLGICYYVGEGVTKDAIEAAKWFRKAAEQGDADAQNNLGTCFNKGEGVPKDVVEAVKWYRKAAEQGCADAQYNLGVCYSKGESVSKDGAEAVRWYRKAVEQDYAKGQVGLGDCYFLGQGVVQDYVQAVKWYRKAAEQNYAEAQNNLGVCYHNGQGVPMDGVEAYKWWLLAAGQAEKSAKEHVTMLENMLTPEQLVEGQKLARNFKPRAGPSVRVDSSAGSIVQTRPESSGTGFFITEDGYLITNEHVVGNAAQVRLVTQTGILSAKVVKEDAANDLVLLKAEGRFTALPVASSRSVNMGSTVATVGFPNIGLQGFAPKLAKGEIAALSGAQDDSRYFQISVPIQPGNSGGGLVDERGNVVGVVSAKLSAAAALATSGTLPENVNYAVKSSFLLSFLESVPGVSARLKQPNARERKFEQLAKEVQEASALVLVY